MVDRTCGTCNACCIAPKVDGVNEAWTRCPHLKDHPSKHSCLIYDKRPDICQKFECVWLQKHNWDSMPNAMRPDKCGVMLTGEEDGSVKVWELWDGAVSQPYVLMVLQRIMNNGTPLKFVKQGVDKDGNPNGETVWGSTADTRCTASDLWQAAEQAQGGRGDQPGSHV